MSIEKVYRCGLLGCTGNINSLLLEALPRIVKDIPQAGGYEIRLITRDPDYVKSVLSNEAAFSSPRLTFTVCEGSIGDCIQVDDDSSSIAKKTRMLANLQGLDRIFFCLPQTLSSTEMIQYSNGFADCVVQAGISVVIRISSYGIARPDPPQGALARAHLAGEKYMREKCLSVTSIRPTSFFSNFLKYDVPSIKSTSSFYSPLGEVACVNWISCQDIADVAAHAFLNPILDGRELEVTGSKANTFSTTSMRNTIGEFLGRPVTYHELPLPDSSNDMKELWEFLRAGGFDCCTDVVLLVTGRPPVEFSTLFPLLLEN
jgi:uncharacterized protein YbjT (DUF2867 family)